MMSSWHIKKVLGNNTGNINKVWSLVNNNALMLAR